LKRNEFAKHIEVLNKQFYHFCKHELNTNTNNSNNNKNNSKSALCIEAAQDYIDYISQLKDRYMREVGCIMTFGSGDCGQLAHGVERDEDLMCKYPRMVSSMQQYRVSSVACGGLHNAIVTADGLVFTWGCSDDGSLGR